MAKNFEFPTDPAIIAGIEGCLQEIRNIAAQVKSGQDAINEIKDRMKEEFGIPKGTATDLLNLGDSETEASATFCYYDNLESFLDRVKQATREREAKMAG